MVEPYEYIQNKRTDRTYISKQIKVAEGDDTRTGRIISKVIMQWHSSVIQALCERRNMKHYFAGYYLIKPRKGTFGSIVDREVATCSSCINDSLLDSWSFSWTEPIKHQLEFLKNDLKIDDTQQAKVQEWVDEKFDKKIIGWPDVFSDIAVVREYSDKFFSHIENRMILKLLFPENEMNDFLSAFKEDDPKIGVSGVYDNLSKKIECKLDENEEILGWDLIGVEYGGGFHTFHCHDIEKDLESKFGLELNRYGLIEDINNSDKVTEYLNDDETGVEPVPWFVVKVIRVKMGN